VALSRRSGGRSRLTIALLVLTSLTLLTLDFRDAAVVQSARRVAGTALSPLKGAAEAASEPFTRAWHGITDYGEVERENEELRRQLDELEGRVVLEEDAAQQLAELLSQQDLEWVGAIPTTVARVVSGSPSNFAYTIEISKGRDDGIREGMPVVNGAGLVGKVVLASKDRATVQLITDPDFAVGVRLLGSGTPGTARGQGRAEDLLVDTSLPADTDPVPEDDTPAVTSGVDGSTFPASIPVGRVTEVRTANGRLNLELLLTPLADTERLAFVTVMLWPEAP
jgi:rod shape-determining protein MreC